MDLSHSHERLGDKPEFLLAVSLRIAHGAGALRSNDLKRVSGEQRKSTGSRSRD